jgi:peptidoglycan-N-acetylglucosamine deacetylase
MISIVIPAFNEEKYIQDCLESLAAQEFKGEYEVVVVNNSCTDGTEKIAIDHGARVISCPTKGVVYARQAGADFARGDIIVQADADTVYPRDWLSKIQNHFDADSRLAAVAGFFYYKEPPRWAWLEYFIRKFANSVFGVPFLRHPFMVSGANFAFRKSAFRKINGYHHDSLYPDQWGICHSLSSAGKIKYDISVKAFTSHRRVQKPFIEVAGDTVKNIRGLCRYFFKHVFGSLTSVFRRKLLPREKLVLVLLLAAAVIGYFGFGYAHPASQAFGQVYSQGETQDRVIALTFDDGPNEPYTSQILDILDKYRVKATFFVVGRNVETYPNVSNRILLEGNVLGNHSYSHDANHALFDDGGAELKFTQEAIRVTTGVTPHLYRPPHGKKSPWESAYLRKLNLAIITWSNSVNDAHDTLIFGKPRPDKLARSFVDQAKPGDIILMHDGHGTDHDCEIANKDCTVKLLPSVIEKLQARGFRFVTVPELLNIPDYN